MSGPQGQSLPDQSTSGRGPRDTARIKVPRTTDRLRDTGRSAPRPSKSWRVCMFAPGLELNGITIATLNLMHALAVSGSKVALVAPGGALREAAASCCHQWIQAPPSRPGFFARRELRQALADFDPQVLHAMTPASLPAAHWAAQATGLPLLATVHGVKPGELPDRHSRHYGFMAVDQAVRERLRNERGIDAERVTLMPHVAFARREANEHAVLHPRRQPVIGFVSPLLPGTGYRTFLDAALRVIARGVDCMFAILGDGPDGAALRDMIEQRDLQQRVVLVQNMYDYGRIWEPFDIIVIDSRQPAAASMVLQAMAGSQPVVATEGGAVFDVVRDGVDGMIVPRDDPDSMAERLIALAQNPAERLRLARAAYERIETAFQEDWVAGALGQVYAAAVAGEPLPKTFEIARRK